MRALLTVASFIATYDIWLIRTGRESITREHNTFCRVHPVVAGLLWGYAVAHLWDLLPDSVDPLDGFGGSLRR